MKIYDYIIIGSGFGGSVAALRLAEKGYSVLVLEQGKQYRPKDFPRTNFRLRRYLWVPALGMYGFQRLSFFRQASILSGVGVGGGSLVYANTLFMPPDSFFSQSSWRRFRNWKETLTPHYDTVSFMLGRQTNPNLKEEDLMLRTIAREMEREETFHTVDVAVYFGDKDIPRDPYFGGEGPSRTGCNECAGCMTGCREDAKNTLDKNYLWFAERYGAEISAFTRAEKIEFAGDHYRITTFRPGMFRHGKKIFRSRNLILAGGTLGTLELLLKQKYKYKTLPLLSETLGSKILTNSETLNAVTFPGRKVNNGIAISSVFHPDDHTHVEIVKYADKANLMKLFFSFAIDGNISQIKRTAKWVMHVLTRPRQFFRFLFGREWSSRTLILLVMQTLDNNMSMRWKKGLTGGKMVIRNDTEKSVPAYIPSGQKVMNLLAEKFGGTPQNILLEVLFNRPTTAHILGGAPMGEHAGEGVIDPRFRVFGYPGMYITDGSAIQANIGVNPSYTIAAQAEYAMSLIPEKSGNTNQPLHELLETENVQVT
jgi:cholesterol oxidase